MMGVLDGRIALVGIESRECAEGRTRLAVRAMMR